MAATNGSKFQLAAAAHQNGQPPNTEYQRTNETFAQYVKRMGANELNPDINPTESDVAYAARLAGYIPAGVTASYAANASNALSAVSASYATSASFAPAAP